MNDSVRMMMCKGCEKHIPDDSPECVFCGWKNPAARRRAKADADDWQCLFELDDLRCPLPGGHNEPAARGPGWCTLHWRDRRRDAGALRQLQEIIADPRPYLPPPPWQDAAIDALVAAHPQWQRAEDEPRSEYVARMRAEQRALSRSLRMPGARGAAAAPEGPDLDAIRAVDESLRKRGLGHLLPQASAAPAARDLEDVIANAGDQFAEHCARLEAEGMSAQLAQQLALDEVLRAHLLRGAA